MGTEIELLSTPTAADAQALSRPRPSSSGSRRSSRASGPTPSCRGSTAAGRLERPRPRSRRHELALEARERTGGRFDPTVHDALVAAGYDRIVRAAFRPTTAATAGRRRLRRPVGVIASTATIELDHGVRLDLGGIGKGYAADRAAECSPAGPCLVNAGGDIAVRGGAGPSASRPATGRHARARRRRARDIRPRPPPLAPRRRGAAPPDRPGDRHARRAPTSCASPSSRGDAVEAEVWRRRCSSPATRARREADARGSPPCSSPPTAARDSREGSREATRRSGSSRARAA